METMISSSKLEIGNHHTLNIEREIWLLNVLIENIGLQPALSIGNAWSN